MLENVNSSVIDFVFRERRAAEHFDSSFMARTHAVFCKTKLENYTECVICF